ncbi:MAG: hypothetical protein AB8G16_12435 [Gammaproteobacteria bacterium]
MKNSVGTITILAMGALVLGGCGQSESATSSPAAEMAAKATSLVPLIDPNTASAAALGAVAGLDAAAVDAIVAGRPFATPGELHAAIGSLMDEATQKAVYSAVFVKIGLNSAADADMRLIPSSLTPGKLAHEFEEYRPYDSIEQFQREMSKYVSADEVANLTRYVTLD